MTPDFDDTHFCILAVFKNQVLILAARKNVSSGLAV